MGTFISYTTCECEKHVMTLDLNGLN